MNEPRSYVGKNAYIHYSKFLREKARAEAAEQRLARVRDELDAWDIPEKVAARILSILNSEGEE